MAHVTTIPRGNAKPPGSPCTVVDGNRISNPKGHPVLPVVDRGGHWAHFILPITRTVRTVAHISLPTKTVRSSERIFNSLRVPIPTAAEFELWINCGADSSFRGMCRPRPPSATHSRPWFFLCHQSREGKWMVKTDSPPIIEKTNFANTSSATRIPSFAIFCYVFLCEFRGPAWK